MKLEAKALSDLPEVAGKLIDFLDQNNRKKVLFYGEMGAGKTTLINAILDMMGIEDHSSSPTFSIVNEYFSVNFGTIYHFDFYRIKDEVEAYDIGVEEIFEEDAYIFIEWPERIENLLPENAVRLKITLHDQVRTIDVVL
ncbi:MAG: tRNA (adenosine(37)-N6)-threonylcarbamoyltransferase complex ATPase subunit type 1 TsaE [Crocinitomicaceae bacterium]|nr:tRNA (adenosine(37)-N6)-threonylcarbamoyltransferase complex ATPase subunit type 1 TsaE [Crocinitomicaceae bacterium]